MIIISLINIVNKIIKTEPKTFNYNYLYKQANDVLLLDSFFKFYKYEKYTNENIYFKLEKIDRLDEFKGKTQIKIDSYYKDENTNKYKNYVETSLFIVNDNSKNIWARNLALFDDISIYEDKLIISVKFDNFNLNNFIIVPISSFLQSKEELENIVNRIKMDITL